MKSRIFYLAMALLITSSVGYSQEIKTLLQVKNSGGYGALTNKFTNINGHYANLAGVYAGWYVNHKFMIGVSGAALTNNLPVAPGFSAQPGRNLSYEYGQCGLMLEYVVASHRAIHVGFQLFSGAGFTTQYDRYTSDKSGSYKDNNAWGTQWFQVTEPGVNVEMNVFKWMRVCPGVSYRKGFGTPGEGLDMKDIDGMCYNMSLKFGKF